MKAQKEGFQFNLNAMNNFNLPPEYSDWSKQAIEIVNKSVLSSEDMDAFMFCLKVLGEEERKNNIQGELSGALVNLRDALVHYYKGSNDFTEGMAFQLKSYLKNLSKNGSNNNYYAPFINGIANSVKVKGKNIGWVPSKQISLIKDKIVDLKSYTQDVDLDVNSLNSLKSSNLTKYLAIQNIVDIIFKNLSTASGTAECSFASSFSTIFPSESLIDEYNGIRDHMMHELGKIESDKLSKALNFIVSELEGHLNLDVVALAKLDFVSFVDNADYLQQQIIFLHNKVNRLNGNLYEKGFYTDQGFLTPKFDPNTQTYIFEKLGKGGKPTKEIKKLKNNKNVVNPYVKHFSRQVNKIGNDIAVIGQEVSSLNEKRFAIELLIDNLKTDNNLTHESQNRVLELEERIVQLDESRVQLEEQKEELSKQIEVLQEAIKNLETENGALIVDNAQKSEEILALETEKQSFVQRIEGFELTIEEMKSENQLLVKENTQQAADIYSLGEEKQSLTQQIKDLGLTIEGIKADAQALVKSDSKKADKIDVLKEQRLILEEDIKHFNQTINNLKSENADLLVCNLKQKAEIDTLSDKLDLSEVQKLTLEGTAERLKLENQALQSQLNDTTQDLSSLNSALQEENDELKRALNENDEEIAHLRMLLKEKNEGSSSEAETERQEVYCTLF